MGSSKTRISPRICSTGFGRKRPFLSSDYKPRGYILGAAVDSPSSTPPSQSEDEASAQRGGKLRTRERDRALPTLLEFLGPAVPEATFELDNYMNLFHVSWVLVTNDQKVLIHM